MSGPHDDRIREAYKEVRAQDAARAPTFDAVLFRARNRRPGWAGSILPWGLGLGLAGAASAAALVLLLPSRADMSSEPAAMMPPDPEPLASLLARPGRSKTNNLDASPIPRRRLLGTWE